MEVSFEPFQIDNIARMDESFVTEDNAIYEECSICYESFTNKSFINECLHPFCYKCIIDWTKVKAVCPLCIRPITRILHNIRSQDDYDVEEVVPPKIDVLADIESDFIFGVDDTDTDSSYGGMESMDMESDFDGSDIYENDDFTDNNFEVGPDNFLDYLTDNDEYHDGDASVHSSNENNESEDEDKDENPVENVEISSSSESSENEDDHDFYNTVSDLEPENEDEEYDCDSNDEDNNDVDVEDDSESNYFDNFYEDADAQEYEEEPENDLETFDVSDDSYESHEDEEEVEHSSPSDDDDDDYYLSDRC